MSILHDSDPRIKEAERVEKKISKLRASISQEVRSSTMDLINELVNLSEQAGVLNYRIELDL